MYREANAWQSSFFAPHDTEGLIGLYKSKADFEKHLDQLFSIPWNPNYIAENINSFIGQYTRQPAGSRIRLPVLLSGQTREITSDPEYDHEPLLLDGRRGASPVWDGRCRGNVLVVRFQCDRPLPIFTSRSGLRRNRSPVQQSKDRHNEKGTHR
jgi:hypothetical protein